MPALADPGPFGPMSSFLGPHQAYFLRPPRARLLRLRRTRFFASTSALSFAVTSGLAEVFAGPVSASGQAHRLPFFGLISRRCPGPAHLGSGVPLLNEHDPCIFSQLDEITYCTRTSSLGQLGDGVCCPRTSTLAN